MNNAVRLDDYDQRIPESLWRLYRYSAIQGCWIPEQPIVEVLDRPGEPMSYRYRARHCYQFNGLWYSTLDAAYAALPEQLTRERLERYP